VKEEDDDPLPTTSNYDIRVPTVKQTADFLQRCRWPVENKASYMPLKTDDTPNGGTFVTFETSSV